MAELDFNALSEDVTGILAKEGKMVLATSSGDRVTARTINHVNDGPDIYFGTSNLSCKYQQLIANPNVAIVIGGMQIEAVAAPCGHPGDNAELWKQYHAKFPHLAGAYPSRPDDVVIKCTPQKIVLFRYIGGAVWDTLDLVEKKAYRQ